MVKELTVAQVLAETLKKHGTSRIYGLVGTTILDFIDTLYEYSSDINFITTRHEQVAVSAADAEARVTGKAGVAVVHAGPGLLNSAIALGIAHKDRVPLLLITGGVRRRLKGTNAWLEIDQESIAKSVSKYYRRIRNPDEVLIALREAFESIYKPPRSVAIIEIPEDLWFQKIQVKGNFLEGMEFVPHEEDIPVSIVENIIDKFVRSKKPLIYTCGELTVHGRFSQEMLLDLAERLDSYIVVSGNARGSCPEDHFKCLGRIGFGGGNIVADNAFQSSDFVLVLGNEFDDLHTYGYTMLPSGDVIVVSKDPEVFKRPNYYEIIEHDPTSFLKILHKMVKERNLRVSKETWNQEISKYRKLWTEMLNDALSRKYENKVNPSLFFKELDSVLPRDRIITAGQGTHIVYVYDYMKIYMPNSFLASTNLGAMSYAFPAAIGAKLAMP
ncbi:MAG: thiamine pyrophosphate-binding protein, partial [Thermoprotei archaeon]